METLEAVKLTGAAAGGAAAAVLALYRFFMPRTDCDARHQPLAQLSATVIQQGVDQHTLRDAFIALRRDVRWGLSIQAAVAKHLDIPIPEQPEGED